MDATKNPSHPYLSQHTLASLAALMLAAASSHAQLQWSSYDTSGALVTANVAYGGDSTYGGSATFTVPAGTQLSFVTKSFVPFSLATASSRMVVTYQMSASGSITSGRCMGWGLYNSAGTASFSDDVGYFGLWNASGPYNETYDHPSGTVNLFSGTKLGQGGTYSGSLATGTIYTNQIQLIMNSSATGISLGNGGSSLTAAGLAITGPNVKQYAYCNPVIPLLGGVSTFDEFAFMFYNSSTNPVTVTLSGISLVPANPAISMQPLGYSGSVGDNTPGTDFAVILNTNSATPLTYQWYQATASATNLVANGVTANGTTISGSTTANLSFANAQVADSGNYFVVITNAYGSVTSLPAPLTIFASPTAPVITGIAPSSALTIAGQGTNVVVSATGAPSPFYLWYDNNSNLIQAASSPVLALSNVQSSGAGTYSVIASNSVGTAATNFTITVATTPSISSQPTNLLLNVGDTATFSVTASAMPAPTYQWYKGNTAIPGATNTSYSITNVAVTNIGTYKVVVMNIAGTVTSAGAVLAIYSTTMSGAPVAPANNATGVCYDTPLTMTFNQPPTAGTTGKIYIYNITNSSTPVDTLDMSQNAFNGTQSRTIGGDTFNTYPVIVSGNTAVVYPHLDVLTSNQTYYVTMDPGVLLDTNGAYFAGISATNTWQFTTKPGGPANPTSLVVAQNYSGDFATVQGAVDSVSSGNTTYTVINIANGFYREIVDIHFKNNLVLRGQTRAGTIIGYANNASVAPGGNTHSRMAVKVNANDIAFDNLTITNLTPQDASQAEALMIESGAARIIVNNCNVDSYQDTILANQSSSKAYFHNSLIQGDVDFIWGGGNLFFTNCEIRYLIRAANSAALGPNPSPTSTDIFSNGFSFVNCALTTLPGANPNDTVGRTRSITNGNTALINCFVSTNIGGWYPDAIPTNNYRNWYSGCTNDLGASVTLSNGIALSAGDPNVTLASSATAWLYGWAPALSPNITSQPTNQSASVGQPVNFAVRATGVPDPTYQWFKNGTNLPGATSPTLNVTNVQRSDGGTYYYVVVSNSSGSVTSSVVTLTFINSAPVATNFTMGALLRTPSTVQIIGGKYSPTDPDGDPLTVTGVTGATNGTVTTDGINATYTATNGPGDAFTYTVSDGYGGAASAAVTVDISTNISSYNLLSAAIQGNGTNVLTYSGIPTDNYALDMATNLTPPINWMPQITNPAANNGSLIYTNLSAAPQSFYRTRRVP